MWIARDKDGSLWLYVDNKPKRILIEWQTTNRIERLCNINRLLFNDLKWEDEPIEVELVRKDEKK